MIVADFLVIDKISKHFGALRAVDQVSLQIARGEAFSLLGPSGCGKTTLLRMLAGFERPDSGRIMLNDADITDLPPERRPVNTVFQNYALFPHLTVSDNVAFGLRMAGRPRAEIRKAVDYMLEQVRLREHASKRPAQLSGGQRQRVAIARALVNAPQVLLLDEPLAALDLKLRQHMLGELNAIHERVGTTFIYVTHDQGEAMGLSDRIAVMNEGHVEQVDEPRILYEAPLTRFVASFIGDANLMTAPVAEVLPGGYIRLAMPTLNAPLVQNGHRIAAGSVVRWMVRPEKLCLSAQQPTAQPMNAFRMVVDDVAYFGPHLRCTLRVGTDTLNAQVQLNRIYDTNSVPRRGMEMWTSFHPDDAFVVEVISS